MPAGCWNWLSKLRTAKSTSKSWIGTFFAVVIVFVVGLLLGWGAVAFGIIGGLLFLDVITGILFTRRVNEIHKRKRESTNSALPHKLPPPYGLLRQLEGSVRTPLEQHLLGLLKVSYGLDPHLPVNKEEKG